MPRLARVVFVRPLNWRSPRFAERTEDKFNPLAFEIDRGCSDSALNLTGHSMAFQPTPLEVVMKSHLASNCALVGGDTALEEVRQLLNVLKFHECERILGMKGRLDSKALQA